MKPGDAARRAAHMLFGAFLLEAAVNGETGKARFAANYQFRSRRLRNLEPASP